MRTSCKRFVAAGWLLASSAAVDAYEISTHALITGQAAQRSVLNPQAANTIIPVLGFDRLDAIEPFRAPYYAMFLGFHRYYDDPPTPIDLLPPYQFTQARKLQERERSIFQMLADRGYLVGVTSAAQVSTRVDGWLMRGAIREDDNDVRQVGVWWQDGSDRDADPYGPILRAVKHFYDPAKDRAFQQERECTVENYGCIRSIVWGLGRLNPIDPLTDGEDLARRNHFTWQDARNNYWLALTLRRDLGTPGRDAAERRDNSQERQWRWATAIKSLGHVVHLLQDVAQPQHTRNDAHAPPRGTAPGEGKADAAFEAFTDYRVTLDYAGASGSGGVAGNPLRHINGVLPKPGEVPRLVLGNYPKVAFSTPVKFMTTRHIDTGTSAAALLQRRGLADYSNRGFFTSGTSPGSRECIPPGADPCTQYATTPTYVLPDESLPSPAFTTVTYDSELFVSGNTVRVTEYAATVADAATPGYTDQLPSRYSGRVPLLTGTVWSRVLDLISPPAPTSAGYTVTYDNMTYQADVLIPRAIGYSAGMIDFFFRGRLEVLPPDTGSFAILNQGEAHTMDADGYPRLVSDSSLFGFEKVRLKVRNATAAITDSGTSESFPQFIGDPDGGGPLKGELVAVARFHRNLCYRPDLSGERVQGYAQPPLPGPITEPTCPTGKRSDYQEISVSTPLTITSPGDNSPSELDNLAAGTGVEKVFDFSADPIPVNATDLFIQVVYRGRMGKNLDSQSRGGNLEPDAIALGTYDAREPTFITWWNNTDYFNSDGNWLPENVAFPRRTTLSFWVCTGAPSRLAWTYFSSVKGGVAMPIPPTPGFVRIAAITGIPVGTTRFAFRGTPDSIETPEPLPRSAFTRGQIKQANKEVVSAATLAAPLTDCDATPPPASEHWCDQPVQRRRGAILGQTVQPIYQEVVASNDPVDVDQPPLPAFSSATGRTAGTLRYDNDNPLASCPIPSAMSPEQLDLMLLEEQLGAMGGDH